MLERKERVQMPELSAADRAILERFHECLPPTVPLVQALVFGSRAQGTATAESDLDLLVVLLRIDPEIREAVYDAAWEAGFPDVLVAPVLVTLEALQRGMATSGFYQSALRDGVGR